jgi:hypothetical protein
MYDLSSFAQSFQDVSGTSNGQFSVKYKTLGTEKIELTYMSIVHFAEERSLQNQTRIETERSVQLISDVIKKLKERYKELTGKSIKLSEVQTSDGFELVSASSTSQRKIAYYRRHTLFEVK